MNQLATTTALRVGAKTSLAIPVLLGSVRSDRMSPRAAQLVMRELERRGHMPHLVDPLELQLPLLDRMYKEHPRGGAGAARASGRALPKRRRIPHRQRRV